MLRSRLSLLLVIALAAAPTPLSAAAAFPESDVQLLLTFKAGITNWDEVAAARGLRGWAPCETDNEPTCLPVCSWSGIECNPYLSGSGNAVTALRLPCREGCTAPLHGRLTPGIHRLQQLAYLHLDGNELAGPLPDEWGQPHSFPRLLELNLNDNQLTGTMPDIWSIGPAFEMLADLQLAGNQLNGTFPAGFAVTNTSFWSLMSFNFANNRFSGPLPDYINGMITMTYARLDNNAFTGTLPPQWGTQGYFWNNSYNGTQALEYLSLHNNRLTGTLPAEWGGPGSFTVLKQLTLSGNAGLVGTLPVEWGNATAASLPALEDLNVSNTAISGPLPPWGPYPAKLRTLTIYNSNISGSIPSSWAQLANLQEVILQPGNPCLDPALPPDSAFQACAADDMLCMDALSFDPLQCTAQAPGDSGSSFPVVAVVVPAVGAALVLLAASLLWWRNRKRSIGTQHHESGDKQAGFKDAEAGLGQAEYFKAGAVLASNPAAVVPIGQPSTALRSSSMGTSHSSSQPFSSSGDTSLDAAAAPSKGLPTLQLSDWEIQPEEIQVMKRSDGSDHRLGRGAFGIVVKAMRNGVQPVAVKILRDTDASKAVSDADFAREIAILRACRDTNILQFQGACFQDGRTMLVTEFMEGGSLAHNLRARKVSWYRRGRKIAVDVARALVYLHSRRIIHLDLKSPNVLLTRDGTAKVGDVGMAKIMAGDYVTGTIGTLAWSAPELLLGQRCTEKADIYSFGVVLWELCTGELPVRGQLRDPRVPEECPTEVVALIHSCLAPDPAARPTATELAEALLRVGSAAPQVTVSVAAAGIPPTPSTALSTAATLPTGAGSWAPVSGSPGTTAASAPATVGTSDAAAQRHTSSNSGYVADIQQQSSLEEHLVTELTEELCREAAQQGQHAVPPSSQQTKDGTRRLRAERAKASTANMQRRLVLTSGAHQASPFTRGPTASPIAGAPQGSRTDSARSSGSKFC